MIFKKEAYYKHSTFETNLSSEGITNILINSEKKEK